jgi:hypothetical protein
MSKPRCGQVLCLLLAAALPVSAAEPGIQLRDVGGAVQLSIGEGAATLSIVGPEGTAWQGTVDKVGTFSAEQLGRALPDGLYRWEARPVAASRVRSVDAEVAEVAILGSGVFRVINGAVVLPDPSATEGAGLKDQVIPDDLIVQGSICVGLDCVNNESFGFDTIRLKENNTRIKFEDTSVGTFPSNDWQLTANDSASGGQNKFAIEDVTGARVPLTVEAGATTNSVYVDSTGRIGFRTSTPVLDLHVNTSNTPGIRLEQNSSGGFTAQTWDIAGNEANFFVRDVTSGSRLPLRIRPGAPSSSLDISADGEVGIGTGSPDQKLDVIGGDIRVRKDGAAAGNTTSLFLDNVNNGVDSTWILRANGTTGVFTLTRGGGVSPFRINANAVANTLDVLATGVNVVGQLTVNGTGVNVPDFVFDESYDLMSIADQGRHMREQRHLPAVPKETLGTDGRPVVDVVAYQMGILEELEKAHLYIQQLHSELTELRNMVAATSEAASPANP